MRCLAQAQWSSERALDSAFLVATEIGRRVGDTRAATRNSSFLGLLPAIILDRASPNEDAMDFDNEDYTEDAAAEGGGGGFQIELLRSYLDFARRALRKRWLLSASIVVTILALTIVATIFWPRTYSCTTVLMPVGNSLLDGKGTPPLLIGAEDLIMRHENLEAIIRDTGLVQIYEDRRPPILKLKDHLMQTLVGKYDEKTLMTILLGTLESRLHVTTEKSDLSIKAEWSDAITAAALAEAGRQSFIRARHVAEMSAFEEKMAIWDQHATKLRADIEVYADQVAQSRKDRLKQAKGEQAALDKNSAATADVKPRVIRSVTAAPAAPDVELPVLKEKLEGLKRKLADLQGDRERRLQEAQAKYDDLKLRLTQSHPDVVSQAQRVSMLAQPTTEEQLAQTEVTEAEANLKMRDGLAHGGVPSITTTLLGGGAGARPGGDAPLPPEIVALLSNDDGDPALNAQLLSAVSAYTSMRSEILTMRIDLDTAQAAFNHRYQVIIPADPPGKPDKPKPALMIVIGFLLAILVGAAVPISLDLKKGILTDRWQVEHELPVLAELHLPPYTGD